MMHIEFFKLQSKNLVKDYKTQFKKEGEGVFSYAPRFFCVDQIVKDFNVSEAGNLTLMQAQHIVAKLAGFKNWAELIKATESELEFGKWFFCVNKNKGKPKGTINLEELKKNMPNLKSSRIMGTAKLKDGKVLELEFGNWQGHEDDIVELNCGYNLDSDPQPISMLKNLKKLVIYAAGIDNLSFVAALNKLEVLECIINKIVDLTPLKNLKLLRELSLAENSIKDLSPLENLENLEKLDVSDNCIKSLASISKMKNLKIINFIYQRPFIEDLTPLANIENLRISVIDGEFGESTTTYKQIDERIKGGKAVSGIKK